MIYISTYIEKVHTMNGKISLWNLMLACLSGRQDRTVNERGPKDNIKAHRGETLFTAMGSCERGITK